MSRQFLPRAALLLAFLAAVTGYAARAQATPAESVRFTSSPSDFPLAAAGHAATILLDDTASETLKTAAAAFASDIERVTGTRPQILFKLPLSPPSQLILVGVLGQSHLLDTLTAAHKLDATEVTGKWESALTTVIRQSMPGVQSALVIAGSDRRGAAYALFTLSRQMGVSPWNWWADVPVPHHDGIWVEATQSVMHEPSVKYRGIFLNDEDWGLRPWASKVMDPKLNNIGPTTYARIFELLLRLHANTLWPAMHPGSLAFNAVQENAKLADRWGIVMGSSHSEALLRNNVGEWDEKRDGPWNYQENAPAIAAYWDKRVKENGHFENFYTVGMRGVHDSGLEATGTPEVKARLVEQVMTDQRGILTRNIGSDLAKIPQVIWLYKESLDLYRAGMKVPDDVTLGWTDDNYGYIRQLPNAAEQKRAGGSGVYYHVSYWGSPHDYLWLCTTPPALIREEMTKAFDHGARRYWILNVGDLKPAEADIDYFMQLGWDEPHTAAIEQEAWLTTWAAEQFPAASAAPIADLLDRYYTLNFIRKPEFMGFNGYNDGINRTSFNPNAWADQNKSRQQAWEALRKREQEVSDNLPKAYADAFFELVGYPIEASAAQNEKFLATDRTYLADGGEYAASARAAFDRIQALTAHYNALEGGKWNGMMSSSPRDRQAFRMPQPGNGKTSDTSSITAAWSSGDESQLLLSANAASYTHKQDGPSDKWHVLEDLGISGPSIVYGEPGRLASITAPTPAPWLEYTFTQTATAEPKLELHLLPTFPVDSDHRLRFAVAIDGGTPIELDAAADARQSTWQTNVLRNDNVMSLPLGSLAAGTHTIRFLYRDPGVVLQHIVVSLPGTPPAYPVPPPVKFLKN